MRKGYAHQEKFSTQLQGKDNPGLKEWLSLLLMEVMIRLRTSPHLQRGTQEAPQVGQDRTIFCTTKPSSTFLCLYNIMSSIYSFCGWFWDLGRGKEIHCLQSSDQAGGQIVLFVQKVLTIHVLVLFRRFYFIIIFGNEPFEPTWRFLTWSLSNNYVDRKTLIWQF